MSNKTNIILITADQLQPYELGCYGGTQIQTPHIDRLAKRGAVWDTAITNFPVCMAARSILISGQHNRTATGGKTNVAYPGRLGDFNMPEYPYPRRPHLPDPTLPELLQQAGYTTNAIGKWHIHSWPQDIGFDEYLIPRVHHANSGQIYSKNGGPEFAAEGYNVDFEADAACDYIKEKSEGDEPFFLYHNISPPHCPIADIPEAYRTLYDPEKLVLRENTDESLIQNKEYWYSVYRWDFRYYSFRLPHTTVLPEGYDLKQLAAEYFGAVTWADSAVGRIMDAVDTAGLTDNTRIIFTADHGENLGSHGYVQKGTENDESIRIPMVMAGPSIKPEHQVNNSVASLVDIAPTLLEMTGQAKPEHLQGVSLAEEAAGAEGLGHTACFETPRGIGLRSPDLTVFADLDEQRKLAAQASTVFDNRNDPYQYINQAESGTEPNSALALLFAQLQQTHSKIPWSHLEDDS